MDKHLEKIEKNAKSIKVIINVLMIVVGLIYGFCIFIYQSKENAKQIYDLRLEMVEHRKASEAKYKLLEERVNSNEKDFERTSTKLDVSLTRISNDLQLIKGHLMQKGLDRSK